MTEASGRRRSGTAVVPRPQSKETARPSARVMRMFSKDKDRESPRQSDQAAQAQARAAAASPSPSRPAIPSIISADMTIIGTLHCTGDLQIEGKIEGEIRSKSIVVGEAASVKGPVHADNARISGSIDGEIEANAVTLARTAKVKGDISQANLSIEAGAQFEGHCRQLKAEIDYSGQAPSVTKLTSSPQAAKAAAGAGSNDAANQLAKVKDQVS